MYLGKWPADFVVPRIVTARKGSFGQGNVFTPVCLFTGAWGSAQPPWMQTPSPCMENPLPHGCRPPWMQTPTWMQSPFPRYPLPLDADTPSSEIRSTSGWYASYWHAYLLGFSSSVSVRISVNSSNALQAIITKYGSRVTE